MRAEGLVFEQRGEDVALGLVRLGEIDGPRDAGSLLEYVEGMLLAVGLRHVARHASDRRTRIVLALRRAGWLRRLLGPAHHLRVDGVRGRDADHRHEGGAERRER